MSVPRDTSVVTSFSGPFRGSAPSLVQFKLEMDTYGFRDVSGQAQDLLGYPAEAWTRPGFWVERMHPDDYQQVTTLCAVQAQAGQGHEVEYRLIDRTGEVVWVHQIGGPTAQTSTVWGYMMDITERMAQRTDVARVLALRDALLRVISTELSQPINIISGYGKLLERHLSTQGDDVGSDYALGMRDGIEALNGSIQRLRAAAQGEKTSFDEMLASPTADHVEAIASLAETAPVPPVSSAPD